MLRAVLRFAFAPPAGPRPSSKDLTLPPGVTLDAPQDHLAGHMAVAYAETSKDLTPAVYLGKQLTLRHLRGSRTIGGDLTLPIVVSTWRSAGP